MRRGNKREQHIYIYIFNGSVYKHLNNNGSVKKKKIFLKDVTIFRKGTISVPKF